MSLQASENRDRAKVPPALHVAGAASIASPVNASKRRARGLRTLLTLGDGRLVELERVVEEETLGGQDRRQRHDDRRRYQDGRDRQECRLSSPAGEVPARGRGVDALDDLPRPMLGYCRSGARSTNIYGQTQHLRG